MRARTIIGAAACRSSPPGGPGALGQVTARGPSIDQVGPADGRREAARGLAPPHESPDRGSPRHDARPERQARCGRRRSSPAGRSIANSGARAGARGPPRLLGRHPHHRHRPSRTRSSTPRSRSTATAPHGAFRRARSLPIGAQAYGSPVAAATLPDGTPLEAWPGTLGTWAHAGLVPDAPNHDFRRPSAPTATTPASPPTRPAARPSPGTRNAAGHLGVYAQDVAADGSPVGSAVNMPSAPPSMQVGQRRPHPDRRPGGRLASTWSYATGYPTQIADPDLEGGAAAGRPSSRAPPAARTPPWPPTTRPALDRVAWVDDDGSGTPTSSPAGSNPSGRVFGETVDAGRAAQGRSMVAYQLDASAADGSPRHPRAVLGRHDLGRGDLPHAGAARAHAEVRPACGSPTTRRPP